MQNVPFMPKAIVKNGNGDFYLGKGQFVVKAITDPNTKTPKTKFFKFDDASLAIKKFERLYRKNGGRGNSN